MGLQTIGDCSIMYSYKQDCHVSFTPPPELHPNYWNADVSKITYLWGLVYLPPSLLRNNLQQPVKLTINTGIDFSGSELA